MQPSSSTISAPRYRKGIATALAVVAAAGVGVGLAVVTSDDNSSPAAQQQVVPARSSLPQGNEGKLAVPPESSSPINDRFHRFQHFPR